MGTTTTLLALAIATAGVSVLHAAHQPASPARRSAVTAPDTAVFADGCFWGIEGVFRHLKGATSAVSGFAGGTMASPSYEDVSSGTTGHAESVQVVYNPGTISYAQLLQVFFTVAHDPTQLNRQGPDVGTQYRSAIFYRSAGQQRAAESYVAQLAHARTYLNPIVTQIVPLTAFYQAEAYHQNYMALHPNQPYIVYNGAPKVVRLKQAFPALYREP
jgi:peptide-methionine (S)-S-oxide reductase